MRDHRDGRRARGGVTRQDDRRRPATLLGAAGGLVALLLALTLAVPLGAAPSRPSGDLGTKSATYVPAVLIEQAASAPETSFDVIVQGDGTLDASGVARHVASVAARPGHSLSEGAMQASRSANSRRFLKTQITSRLTAIDGVAARLTGEQIRALAESGEGIVSITPDAPVRVDAVRWTSTQPWVKASGVDGNWEGDARRAHKLPAIAIVDSGIESRSDFGARIVASVDLTSLPGNSTGDGRGHGTFVAGIAAGAARDYAGAAPAADLVSVDVIGDDGMGLTSDVIRACQWILAHADEYGIRVANFSLHSTISVPFHLDPLDRAVEQLWFDGIVVVAAAGNYGSVDGPSGVRYSPANDPFVVTVGAVDISASPDLADDVPAPWSAWGATLDGFAKPELAAPGRYMVGPVPVASTLVSERPAQIVAPGYMELSGTSFAAPVVSGTVASLLARTPSLGPDEVKGALMLTARPLVGLRNASMGVGELDADAAAAVKAAPNPNLALGEYVRPTADGSGVAFDAAAWYADAKSDASWNSASWNSASWNSASWNSASWNSASWNTASWSSASWNSASWNSASWDTASWNSASWNSASWNSDLWTASVDGASHDPPPGIAGPSG